MPAHADNSRIPVGKFAWLMVVTLLAAPFLFFALVTPKEKPVAEPTRIELPPSKLKTVGLRENRDWDGLPEMFAVWADGLEWTEGSTRFAYWNPVARGYGYFFEARRKGNGFLICEISKADAFRGREVFPDGRYFRSRAGPAAPGGSYGEFEESPSHPFVFLREFERQRLPPLIRVPDGVLRDGVFLRPAIPVGTAPDPTNR